MSILHIYRILRWTVGTFVVLHSSLLLHCELWKFTSPHSHRCMPCELNQKFFQCSPIVRNSCRLFLLFAVDAPIFMADRKWKNIFLPSGRCYPRYSINFMMRMDEDVFSSFHLLFFFYQNESCVDDVVTTVSVVNPVIVRFLVWILWLSWARVYEFKTSLAGI